MSPRLDSPRGGGLDGGGAPALPVSPYPHAENFVKNAARSGKLAATQHRQSASTHRGGSPQVRWCMPRYTRWSVGKLEDAS
jgi:hypothetical protein